jgi:predicted Zn-dependent protease with MMP-like domain
MVDPEIFEGFVTEALNALPDKFRDALENLEILIEDWPDYHTQQLARVHSAYELLGFYHGIPLTARTTNYGLVAPDKISIYQKPIEAQCATEAEVRELAHTVLRHEIAHYFGLSDDRLRALGAY